MTKIKCVNIKNEIHSFSVKKRMNNNEKKKNLEKNSKKLIEEYE